MPRELFSIVSRRVIAPTILLCFAVSCGEHRATGVINPGGATLLRCPTSQAQSTTALVSTLGGVVNLGATAVRIPSGALSAATLITLSIPASEYMEIEVRANNLTSFVFQQQVAITIDYSRCNRTDTDGRALSVWRIDTHTKELLENMGGTDDKTSRSITFTTGHLSGYAVSF